MFKFFIRLFLIALIGGVSPVSAIVLNVAVVDTLEVLRQSLAMQELQKTFMQHLQADKTFIAKMEKLLREREQKLAKEIRNISQASQANELQDKKRNVLVEEKQSYERDVTAFQDFLLRRKEYLENVFSEAKNKVQDKVNDIVKELAQSQGHTIILSRSQIVYAQSDIDLTAQIVTRINQTIPSLQLSVDSIRSAKKKFDKEQKEVAHVR